MRPLFDLLDICGVCCENIFFLITKVDLRNGCSDQNNESEKCLDGDNVGRCVWNGNFFYINENYYFYPGWVHRQPLVC
jgi:hypothetical protein